MRQEDQEYLGERILPTQRTSVAEARGLCKADWRTPSFQGYTVVSIVTAVVEVGPPLPDSQPFAGLTDKMLERTDGAFAAHLNGTVLGGRASRWAASTGRRPATKWRSPPG